VKQLAAILIAVLMLGGQLGAEYICSTSLDVLNYQVAWEDLTVDIDNPDPAPQTGGIIVEFSMNGHTYKWWFDTATIPANTVWEMQIEFPSALVVHSVSPCDEMPPESSGVVEAPDPVANNVKQKKK